MNRLSFRPVEENTITGLKQYRRGGTTSGMSVDFITERMDCLHLERRVVERISRGISHETRPDLILWICHFPLPSLSGIQCRVLAKGTYCPHNGPYSRN